MNPIVLAVLIVAGLALAAGLILAVASVVMAVPRDEKAEALRAVLPGANCGACGYSGCDGYAKAMAHEGAKGGLCSPGGAAVAEATAINFIAGDLFSIIDFFKEKISAWQQRHAVSGTFVL